MNFHTPWEQYNDEGVNAATGAHFYDTLGHWEAAFHTRFACYANYLFANSIGMSLLDKCLQEPNSKCGFELINGNVNLDVWFKIEKNSDFRTIYAIGSQLPQNLEEPVFLVVDEHLADGTFLLKHLPDDDDEADVAEPLPADKICAR